MAKVSMLMLLLQTIQVKLYEKFASLVSWTNKFVLVILSVSKNKHKLSLDTLIARV